MSGMDIFITIITPLGILFAIALVFGVILSYAGKKLEVKVDEKEEEVLSLLANANCGACGYPGCSGFAKALCEGKAELNMCSATPGENKKKIAGILGIDAGDTGEKRIVVACGGGLICKDKFEYIGYEDCAMALQTAGGNKACSNGCMGFGNCAKVCPSQAIDIKDNRAEINSNCTKCQSCVKTCPIHIIKAIPENAKVYIKCSSHKKGKEVMDVCKSGCIACGMCVRICPFGAIVMEDNLPVIDYDKCTGCGACADKCPTKCIAKLD